MPATKWKTEFQINDQSVGISALGNHNLAALSTGGFVAAYFGTDVAARIFGADGTAAGASVDINPLNDFGNSAKVVILANGNLGFVLSGALFGNGTVDVATSTFTPSLTQVANTAITNTTTAGNQQNQDAAVLSDGRMVAVWTSFDSGDGSGNCIRMRAYEANGTFSAGSDAIVNVTPVGDQYYASVAALAGGKFVVTWQSVEVGATVIRGRTYNSVSSPGAEFTVSTTAAAQGIQSVASLPNGGFIVAYTGIDPVTGGNTSLARIYDAAGVGGQPIVLPVGATTYAISPVLSVLSDGRFMAFWLEQETTAPGSDTKVFARLFNANGTPDGGEIAVSVGAGIHTNISAVTLADGRVAVSWTANNTASGGSYSVMSQIIDPRGATINGDGANNVIYANDANETVNGQNGADKIFGMIGNDTINGGDGNDTINGGPGVDSLTGGVGADVLDYSDAPGAVQVNLLASTVTGAAGADVLTDVFEGAIGGAFADALSGGSGADQLFGGGGADQIFGNGGDDTIVGGDGDDTLVGNGGFDILDYSAVVGVVQVNQLAGTVTGSAGNDVLSDVFEQVIGTAFADVLSGGHGVNVLDGMGGGDQLFGNNGDDLLRGGAGDDRFYASTGDGADRLLGGDDNDTFFAALSDGNDTVTGGNGFDVLDFSGVGGVVQVNQLAGTVTGSAGVDSLLDAIEQVIGTAFGDVLSGSHGINGLFGAHGNDTIFGNNGDDYINGGAGTDTVTLGVGNDVFDMRNGDGVDTITDFVAGGTDDRVDLKNYGGLGFNTFAGLQASGRLSTVAGQAELALNGGDKIVFSNVADHTQLTAADFLFT